MTLYCQTLDQLPEAQMRQLGPGSRLSHFVERDANTGADVERYTYRWSDFQIDLYVTRPPDITAHLKGFVTYANGVVRANRKALDAAFVRRVYATRLVIGYVAGPDYEEPSRFARLEDLILTMCYNTQSLLFWEGRVYDENMNLLIG
jgi:hypothetical protein